MKYIVRNRLGDFEFHDAMFSLVDYSENTLILDATYLNVHHDCDQNPHDCDMEIEQARITFKGFQIDLYTNDSAWEKDANGESQSVEPIVYIKGSAAMEQLLNQFAPHLTVLDLTSVNDGWAPDGCGDEPYFGIRFRFDSVDIEWDEFHRPAWFVLHQQGIKA